MELQSWKRTWRTKLLPVSFQTVLSSINLFSHKFIIAIMPACPNLPSNSVHRIRSPNRETWINWEEYTDRVGIYTSKLSLVNISVYLPENAKICKFTMKERPCSTHLEENKKTELTKRLWACETTAQCGCWKRQSATSAAPHAESTHWDIKDWETGGQDGQGAETRLHKDQLKKSVI